MEKFSNTLVVEVFDAENEYDYIFTNIVDDNKEFQKLSRDEQKEIIVDKIEAINAQGCFIEVEKNTRFDKMRIGNSPLESDYIEIQEGDIIFYSSASIQRIFAPSNKK